MTQDYPATRKYRATLRTRLALTYSALLTGTGLIMLTIIYLFMRFVPEYQLVASTVEPMETEPGSVVLTAEQAAELGGGTPALASTPALTIPITSSEQMLNLLLITSGVVLVVLAILGIWVGWMAAGRTLKPLQYVNTAVRLATHGDLSQRIRLEGPRDEISELAGNFDDMLAQLERSFDSSKRFAANASHELRTPLATTRAMLDVALAQSNDSGDQRTFERLRVMNERSIETVGALLDLADIESSNMAAENMDLADIARQVVADCIDEAGERGVRIDLDLHAAPVEGEPILVRQALMNLVLNALRHNDPAGGFASIRTADLDHGGTSFEIENSGEVLDDATVAGMTEPFARVGVRPSSSSGGHGLGLSIVAAIVERSHGKLALKPRPNGGMIAVVTLPAKA